MHNSSVMDKLVPTAVASLSPTTTVLCSEVSEQITTLLISNPSFTMKLENKSRVKKLSGLEEGKGGWWAKKDGGGEGGNRLKGMEELGKGREKKKHHQLRTVLCGRCRLLSQWHMITTVDGHGGYSGGKQFVSAEELREKLSHLRHEKVLIVKLVDLLPKGTDLNCVGDWVVETTVKKEAQEHLDGDLKHAREESAKLADLYKGEDAHQQGEISRKEKEDTLEKLSQADRTLTERRNRVNKLEEDNRKLRRAFEQNMSRINRMSLDSDFLVDRAGTTFHWSSVDLNMQRPHYCYLASSPLTTFSITCMDVLDLMACMLGFSDEDKQRIGGAQQGTGKGVVHSILGLPGRLVGGILGGGSAEANANMASETTFHFLLQRL
ncbi:P-loop containing nucleoside triphosphate hydrolases superfamily protein [Actinidia rufa]|uniref:P-loop containing nucleoside triphosphate hydrolases superfamily protein n=1 Tax=Actinidia rufa TaxID=165716 RepID=A0A7J0EG89_9ERIC|nr:P-loop containing nucleoside triphosphate hydrolases superfamily protein [Actinidia rufa]